MTTIACRDGVMAADSQFTHGGLSTRGQKLFRVGDAIIGFCGHVHAAMVFVDWYENREARKPDMGNENEWEALVLHGQTLEHWTASLRPVACLDPYYAIGSGSHLAIGAMWAGADARQAIEAARRWDTNTGGRIVTLQNTPKRARKKG